MTVVEPVDDPPVCSQWLGAAYGAGGRVDVEAGEPVQGSFNCSDDEGDDLTLSIAYHPDDGALSRSQVFYGGTDFASAISPSTRRRLSRARPVHAGGERRDAPSDHVVQVNVVDPVNDPPQCTAYVCPGVPEPDGRYSVEGGESYSGTVFCTDEELANLDFSVLDPPDHGTLGPLQLRRAPASNRRFNLTPDPGHRGADQITMRVSDGVNPVDATLRLTVVEAVNDPPTASPSARSSASRASH